MIHTEIIQILTKKTLGLTFVLSAAAMAFAQQKVNVSGNIVDKSNNPVPYASVSFVHKTDTTLSDASLTDEKGHYTLSLAPGNYTVTVEAIDFKKITTSKQITAAGNIGNITVEAESSSTLTPTKDIEGVTITAQATKAYRVELDKKTYDVNQDLISKGGNLQDVLQNVPSVSVDTDGTVSMRGSSNVRFLINGKPSALLGIDDGANALQSIPADQIDKIEVITNPSSKYEASGTAGILNIILKKNKKIGFNGSVTGSIGYLPQTSLNTNLSWRKDKATFFLNGGGGYRESKGKNTNDAIFYNANSVYQTQESHQNSETNSYNRNYNGTAGLVYDFTDKTSANASITLRRFDSESDGFVDSRFAYNGINAGNTSFLYPLTKNRNSIGQNTNNAMQGDFGIDQKLDDNGQNLSVSLSLQKNNSAGNSVIEKYYNGIFNGKDNVDQNTVNKSIVGKVDYEKPIGEKSKIEAGYRLDRNVNDYEYSVLNDGIINPDFTSVTNYKEMINAIYAQFKSRIGEKIGYQVGLRDEISKIDVDFRNLSAIEPSIRKNYNNIFPTVFLSYDFSKNNQLLLNYTRRIDRPRSWFMVPFNSYNDSDNIFTGNPNLNPSYINSYELGYSISKKKFTVNPTVYYRFTEDNVQMTNIYNEQKSRFETMPYNIGTESRYGLDLNFTYDPFPWLKLLGSVDLFGYDSNGSFTYNYNLNGVPMTRTLSYEGNGFSTRTRLTTTFRLDKTFSMQFQGFYRGGQKTATTKQDPMYALNFGATKTIWNGNGTLGFNIQDIFDTRNRTFYSFGDNFERKSYMQWMPRQFSLSLTYRFKQGDKVDQPKRRRDINNNENGGDDMPPM